MNDTTVTSPIDHMLQETFGLSAEQLAEVRSGAESSTASVIEGVLKSELVPEEALLEVVARLYRIPFWKTLPIGGIQPELFEQLPIQFLRRMAMVPLFVNADDSGGENTGSRWVIAVNDPSRFQALDDLVSAIHVSEYQVVLSTRSEIMSAISMAYDLGQDSAEALVQTLADPGSDDVESMAQTADLLDDTSDAPIIKLVNHIISQSIKATASDVHIEPYQNNFKVRYRVDGILYDLLTPPKWIQAALISRIKVMANLNIAEKRLPQDGRFDVRIGEQAIDVRVSSIPTAFGERVVLRLLNKTSSLFHLGDLGMSASPLSRLQQLIVKPNGIILVTGPTGSGKTTTLYAILSSINKPGINIITIEDPIEYQLEGISQIQVNPKIDLTFARGLRSIVRQDPDVILVGEIRDRETSEIAVQSALTGHLVFSTLHTNDSASAITRLVDIGVEPFLISSSLIAVMAQRLVRQLCHDCKTTYLPDRHIFDSLGIDAARFDGKPVFQSNGCEKCLDTGFRGRIGIFEIMVMSDRLQRLILQSSDANNIKQAAIAGGMIPLLEDGMEKVLRGITTIEEVLRVAAA